MQEPGPIEQISSAQLRVLIVRLGAIGDCLRVLPALARIRRGFPDAEIGWAVEHWVAPLLRGHPQIDHIHILDRRRLAAGPREALAELRRLGAEMRELDYRVAIDFHGRLKSGLVTRASGAARRIGFDARSASEINHLFTNVHVAADNPRESRVERFLRLVEPLGLVTEYHPSELGLWVDPELRARAKAWHKEARRPQVAVFAGTSSHRQGDRWPLEKWQAALRRLGERGVATMVLWGPAELENARTIADGSGPLCRLAPATSLQEMMALLACFRVYVGTNTAALHMAWMQDVPCVVLVGGRPWTIDRPMEPVPSVMLTAGNREPETKLRGEEARRAIEDIAVDDVVDSALALLV